jgi:hypothetical protein
MTIGIIETDVHSTNAVNALALFAKWQNIDIQPRRKTKKNGILHVHDDKPKNK